jgi:hypothetical protein
MLIPAVNPSPVSLTPLSDTDEFTDVCDTDDERSLTVPTTLMSHVLPVYTTPMKHALQVQYQEYCFAFLVALIPVLIYLFIKYTAV